MAPFAIDPATEDCWPLTLNGGITVGTLHYGSTLSVEFEDRVLAHLNFAIIVKLRRGESFTFSWKGEQNAGGGRSSVWIDPMIALRFTFTDRRHPKINRQWIERMLAEASSPDGMTVTSEPEVETA